MKKLSLSLSYQLTVLYSELTYYNKKGPAVGAVFFVLGGGVSPGKEFLNKSCLTCILLQLEAKLFEN
uniref:Uncharacterized protein n=1 Tax=Rhizophora mucronata TaxID=61149 RepID=A0A2P2IU16_RHIMU